MRRQSAGCTHWYHHARHRGRQRSLDQAQKASKELYPYIERSRMVRPNQDWPKLALVAAFVLEAWNGKVWSRQSRYATIAFQLNQDLVGLREYRPTGDPSR